MAKQHDKLFKRM